MYTISIQTPVTALSSAVSRDQSALPPEIHKCSYTPKVLVVPILSTFSFLTRRSREPSRANTLKKGSREAEIPKSVDNLTLAAAFVKRVFRVKTRILHMTCKFRC